MRDVVLVRRTASRRGPPDGALALAEDHQLAAIGDPAWPPAEETSRAAWVAPRELDSALAEARGEWMHLRKVMSDLIRPLEDPQVLDLAFGCIDGPDEDLESLAITVAGAERDALTSSQGSTAALTIFAEATHRRCLSTSAARTLLDALWMIQTSQIDEALGIIDLLADQLPEAEQLPALVGPPDRSGEPPDLQWNIARRAWGRTGDRERRTGRSHGRLARHRRGAQLPGERAPRRTPRTLAAATRRSNARVSAARPRATGS